MVWLLRQLVAIVILPLNVAVLIPLWLARRNGTPLALGAGMDQLALQALELALLGLGIGIAVSLGLTQVLKHLLFETSPLDPITFAAVALVLMAIGVLACWIPVRRATRVDPSTALRAE